MKYLKKIFLVMLLAFTAFPAIAGNVDFTVDGFSYAITSTTDLTVEVVKGPDQAVVTVPSTVVFNKRTFRVTGIGSEAFRNYANITSVDMPSITYISDGDYNGRYSYGAFSGCHKLSQVNMPAATSIGVSAFYGCDALRSVNLPAATSIGYGAFSNCDALTSVNLPAATSIGRSAFYGCDALTSVDLPAATSIGYGAFDGCYALTSANLPAATSIGYGAFNNCVALPSVNLPAATSIGEWAFSDCDALPSVNLPAATSIGDRAFYGCDALTSVNLPAATSIGEGAFNDCDALTSVDLPAATSIGSYAFFKCYALTSVNLPAATSIGEGAFNDCDALTSVDLPAATSIGKEAFSYCNALSDIYVGRNPADCYPSTFEKVTYATATLHVPAGCASKYKAAECWKQFNFISEDYDPTGMKSANADKVKVLCENGNVNITGLKNGMRVEFYSVNGQLLAASVANSGAVSFKTSERIVICKMAGTSIKVHVK